jgi:hypothetical protein
MGIKRVATLYGDSFIEQRGNLVGLIALIITREQYDKKQQSAYRVVNSFRVTP